MEKHYNVNHDLLIESEFIDVMEKKSYKEGEDILQKRTVKRIIKYIQNDDGFFTWIVLSRELIESVYKDITEIEKLTQTGKYSELPF